MNAVTSASSLTSVGTLSSGGTSDAARYIAERAKQGRWQLQKSYSLGLEGKGVFSELASLAEECRVPNWDGFGALPVAQETLRQAIRFLQALPLGVSAPSLGAEPDGQLTLEWHRSARYTLSVSVSPEGELHYAALMGLSKVYGTVPFFGEAPPEILDLVYRLNTIDQRGAA